MSNQQVFHFTLGPVQSFVAQARRTRDLWAGSFLLSWLSGHAMKAVLDQGGDIVFPAVMSNGKPADPLLAAILEDPQHTSPQIGSIPNRFKAAVGASFDPNAVVDAVQLQWKKLANAVFDEFIEETCNDFGNDSQAIWNRQVNDFWEINWILGAQSGSRSDDQWLDIRKNWRNHWPSAEAGDHCTVMGDFQELSGFVRAKNRVQQEEFWNHLRQAVPDDYLDIQENERLCSLALVKRLFPRLVNLQAVLGWIPGKEARAVGNWPSTTYLAVAPWLQFIAEDPQKISDLDQYLTTVKNTVPNNYFLKLASEQSTYLATLGLLNSQEMSCGPWKLSDIDGDILHHHALCNHRTTYLSSSPLTLGGQDNNEAERKILTKALGELYGAVGKSPRSFYALLLMDGDRLGKMLREEDQASVSRALLNFTNCVQACVDGDSDFGGVTIYAGGDDVFALLPMNTAINCAQELRQIYSSCFVKEGIGNATASCAIVFAHHQVPLRSVIREAHNQLDGIAKDKNGRDSLALAIFKPGGVTAQWVSAWAATPESNGPTPVDKILELIQRVGDQEYSRGFFHKLRDRYGFYGGQPGTGAPAGLDVQKILVAEYMQTEDKTTSLGEAEKAAGLLKAACQPLFRDQSGATQPQVHLQLDGGFIARFLTQEEE